MLAKSAKYEIQNQQETTAGSRGGVVVQATRITTTKVATAMTIIVKMFVMAPRLLEPGEVPVGAKGTRKSHLIKAEVDMRVKLVNKAADADKDIIKRKGKEITETKTNEAGVRLKETLHRVSSRESATRTRILAGHSSRVTSSPRQRKTSRRRRL